MKPRPGERRHIPAMVIMEMRDDDVFHRRGVNTDQPHRFRRQAMQLAVTGLSFLFFKPDINHKGAPAAGDDPNIEVNRRRLIVRVLKDEIILSHTRVIAIFDSVDFVFRRTGGRRIGRGIHRHFSI